MEYSERVCQLCGISFNIGRIRQPGITSPRPFSHLCVHSLHNTCKTSRKVALGALLDDPARSPLLDVLHPTRKYGQSVTNVKIEIESLLRREGTSTLLDWVAGWNTKGTPVAGSERKR